LLSYIVLPVECYPQAEVFSIATQAQANAIEMNFARAQLQAEDVLPFSYDDVLDLIEELEEGDLEKRCSAEEIERINNFIVELARHGILPNDVYEEFVLENDIEELLHGDELLFSLAYGEDYVLAPAIFYEQGDIVLCKSWFKKKWDQVKKFVKKHKTAILIGAAVVVATTVVICAVAAASTAAAAGAAAASDAASSSDSDSDKKERNKSEQKDKDDEPESSSIPSKIQLEIPIALSAVEEIPLLKEVLDEQIFSSKEVAVEGNILPSSESAGVQSSSLGEDIRDFGSFLAHKIFDEVTELAAFVPQLHDEIKELGEKYLPNIFATPASDFLLPPLATTGNYEKLIYGGHQVIDQAFSTDMADFFTPKAKANDPHFVIGAIPPPVAAGRVAVGEAGRLPATLASNVWGWKIGQDIRNRTIFGTVPKWSTVRKRYWKNQALWAKSNPHDYGAENIPRMEKGLAPQKWNDKKGMWENKELHHNPAQRDGGLFDFIEVWPEEHAALDPNRYIGR
ncbi:MAG: hypothetical protein ACM3JI_05605, partial [Anaerolineae bacterium]